MTLGGPGSGWGPTEDQRPDRVGDRPGDDDHPTHDPGTPGSLGPDDGAVPAPPPRLSPMPISTLLEVSGRIIRRYAAPLLAVSAVFQLPSSLVDALAQQHLGQALSPIVVGLDTDTPQLLTPTPAQSQTILEALVILIGSSILGTLLGAIATLAFTTAVLADYHGRRPSVGAMVRVALRRALPALAAGLLAALALLGVIVGAGVLAAGAMTILPADGGAGGPGAFVAAIVIIVRLGFSAAVLAGEPGGPIQALRRSWYLTGDNTWRAFAVLATVAIAMTIIGSTLLELMAVVITDGLATGVGLADASDALLSGLVSTLLAPVGGVVLAVLYLDLRVRRDAWQPQPDAPGAEVAR